MLTKDDVIMVYEDPLTCQRPEGKARLVRPLIPPRQADAARPEALAYWQVEFLDEPGATYPRWVHPHDRDNPF